jgi:hypothetical protein
MLPLEEVETFGAIDAESDDLLGKCFETHPAYQQAIESNRFLVLGRKGSGKTAVYKRILSLQHQEHHIFSAGHSFTDYPWDYHDRQVIPGAAEQERYIHSWRYLILLSLAKILLNYDQSQPWSEEATEALSRIENFVVDTYGSRDPDITQIFHPGKRLRHLKSFNISLAAIGVGAGIDALEMSHLPRVFQDVNKSVQELALKCLNPDNRYYVCFDELDLTFQPSDTAYKQRLIGLILAARDFANAARESGRFLKVLVFLRSDIYHKALLFEDKNKITDTYKIELEWDQPGGATLKSVMNRRFAELLQIDTDDAWNAVFDETAAMRGHQTKYQHILSRTFRRPRDIIRFCNSILAPFRERKRTKGGPQSVINDDVNLAHFDYSNYLRDEIVDEIHKYHPDYRTYFEILKSIEYQQFTMDDFNKAYEQWKDRFERSIPIDTVLENLFEFSIIGCYRAGGSGFGGSEYVYKYLDPRAEFNRSAERFRVHWGLVDSFGLKQYRVSESKVG